MTLQNTQTPEAILTKPNGALAKIFQHAKKLEQFQRSLKSILPEKLKSHISVINFKNGALILDCDNASLATQLRHGQLDLLSLLRQENGCHGISSIEYRVRPGKVVAKKTAPIKEKKIPPLLRAMVERLKK